MEAFQNILKKTWKNILTLSKVCFTFSKTELSYEI